MHQFAGKSFLWLAAVSSFAVGFFPSVGAGSVSTFQFRDAVTGAAVAPDSVTVDGIEHATQLSADGLALSLSSGDHAVLVRAAGYGDFVATHTVASDIPITNVLHLDPAQVPQELATEALSELQGPTSGGLAGYVVDDATGKPLAGASVSVGVKELATLTDARGYFSLRVSLDDGQPVPGTDNQAVFLQVTLAITKDGYSMHERRNILLVSNDTAVVRIRLSAGEASVVSDERDHRGPLPSLLFDGTDPHAGHEDETLGPPSDAAEGTESQAQVAPATIRLGRTCSCRDCSTVQTISMETYVKHVLPAEWISSWHSNSLKAGAIAIRSYAGYYVYNPIAGNYDICDNTCCQKYGTTTYTSTDNAVDATAGIYMASSSGVIGAAEYSAENNNSPGCGDCYIENKAGDGVCLYDSVCCGTTFYGHGRGMCQWGTQRWASNQSKDYTWICDHYYAAYSWTRQNLSVPPSPTGLSATDGAYTDRVRVTWTASAGASSYQVWRATTNNSGSAGQIGSPGGTTYDDTTAVVGTTYYYWAKAVNGYGASGFSNSDSGYRDSGVAPPTITLHPQPQDVPLDGVATFTVAATGGGTLSYRWQKNGADLNNGGHYSGVTTVTLTVSNADANDVANYRCGVSNIGGTTYSNAAALTLQGSGGVEFIVESRTGGQNVNRYSEIGAWADASSKSTATGATQGIGSRYSSTFYTGRDATFAFEGQAGLHEVFTTWGAGSSRQSGINYTIHHAGGSTPVVVNQSATANVWVSLGQFNFSPGSGHKVVINSYLGVSGSAYADATKWVSINTQPQPPTVTQHPASQSICAGGSANFIVAATGEGTLSYQWQKNGANLSNGGHYAGVTTTTLTVSSADASDGASYRCVVSNNGGSDTSNAATLTVKPATVVAQHPAAVAACLGGSTQFMVAATGDGTLGYQWQKAGVNLTNDGHYSGVTSTTLGITGITGGDVTN